MSRLLASVLITFMVLSLATAAAASGGIQAAARHGAQHVQQVVAQVRSELRALQQDRLNIVALRHEANVLALEAQAEIARIRDSGRQLGQGQLQEIGNLMGNMRGAGKTMAATIGEINQQAKLLRDQAAGGPAAAVSSAFARIKAIQQVRLHSLEDLVESLNNMLQQLQEGR